MENLKIKWHVPTLLDLTLTDKFLFSFLKTEIEQLQSFMTGQQDKDRYIFVLE